MLYIFSMSTFSGIVFLKGHFKKKCFFFMYFLLYNPNVRLVINLHNSYFNLIDYMFEAVRTYPGYGMATLIYNNLLNLILGTVMFLIILL